MLNGLGPVCTSSEEADEDAEQVRLVKQLVQRVVLGRDEEGGQGAGARGDGDESSDFDD